MAMPMTHSVLLRLEPRSNTFDGFSETFLDFFTSGAPIPKLPEYV